MRLSKNWVIIGSDNGLSPVRCQAIIWTNAGILLGGPFGTNFSEFLIGIQTFSFRKLHLKTSSAKWRLFCLGLNELKSYSYLQDFVFVTAASENHLAEFLDLLATLQQHFPGRKVLLYDLGLDPSQRGRVRSTLSECRAQGWFSVCAQPMRDGVTL